MVSVVWIVVVLVSAKERGVWRVVLGGVGFEIKFYELTEFS